MAAGLVRAMPRLIKTECDRGIIGWKEERDG